VKVLFFIILTTLWLYEAVVEHRVEIHSGTPGRASAGPDRERNVAVGPSPAIPVCPRLRRRRRK